MIRLVTFDCTVLSLRAAAVMLAASGSARPHYLAPAFPVASVLMVGLLGWAAWRMEHHDKAETAFRKMEDLARKSPGNNSLALAQSLRGLARVAAMMASRALT